MKEKRLYISELDVPVELESLSLFFPFDPMEIVQNEKLYRQYKLKNVIRGKKSDFDKALAVAKWVSERWGHAGIPKYLNKFDVLNVLKFAEKGYSFSCVQFASVFVQCCHALGIPARSVQVTTKSPDFGDSGQGHITGEYFDNQLKKWIWIDPQIHSYAKKNKSLLSFYELSQELKKGNFSVIKFTERTFEYVKKDVKRYEDLKKFLGGYNGSIVVGVNVENNYFYKKQTASKLCFLNDSVKPYCSFQGFSQGPLEFITLNRLYKRINSTLVRVESLNKNGPPEFKDLEDYKKNKSKFFAEKKIKLHLTNNMPWFLLYRIKINGKLLKCKSTTTTLNLRSGRNEIQISAVSKFGSIGPESKIILNYDSKYKSVKSFW